MGINVQIHGLLDATTLIYFFQEVEQLNLKVIFKGNIINNLVESYEFSILNLVESYEFSISNLVGRE